MTDSKILDFLTVTGTSQGGEALAVRSTSKKAANYFVSAIYASNFGDGIRVGAIPLITLVVSRDPIIVSLATVAQRIPWPLLSLPLGAYLDRVNRLKAIRWALGLQSILFILLFVVLFTSSVSILPFLVIIFLLGCTEIVVDTSAQIVPPQLFADKDLDRVNTRLSRAFLIPNELIGPPVGSAIFAAWPPASMLAALGGSLTSTRILVRSRLEAAVEPATAATQGWVASVKRGFRDLVDTRLLGFLAGVSSVQNFVEGAATAILALYLIDQLGASPIVFGIVLTVGSLGALIASVVARPLFDKPRLAVLVAGFLMVIGAGVFISAPSIYTAAAGLALKSGGIIIWNIVTIGLRQRSVPVERLGSMNSAYRFVAWLGLPLGAFLGGVMASAFGDARSVYVGQFLVLAALLVVILAARRLMPQASSQ